MRNVMAISFAYHFLKLHFIYAEYNGNMMGLIVVRSKYAIWIVFHLCTKLAQRLFVGVPLYL